MSASLNNVATADDYTPANTLYTEGAIKINIQVYNAAIFYKYAPAASNRNPRGTTFNPETFLAPGDFLLVRRAAQVAVRSAVPGVPALVTIEALTDLD